MLSEEKIDELLEEPVRVAIRKAFEIGYQIGSQAVVDVILTGVSRFGDPLQQPPVHRHLVAESGAFELTGEMVAATRAPRGLVDDVLEQVLRERPGMTQEEVEAAVVAVDDRIAPKSVYNKLRSWEKQERRFRRHLGKWYRIADLPAPFPVVASSPKGETGGLAPPASLPDILQGGSDTRPIKESGT